MMNTTASQSGFTLIELALVMAVVALLMGGLLVPLTMQVEQQKIRETQRSMEEIKEALFGYAIANRHLPCPAVSATDGAEGPRDATTHECISRVGFIPWSVLGVSKLDGWGRIFRYSTAPLYSKNMAVFSLTSPRDITIKSRDAAGNQVNFSSTDDIPAVVISHGKNGYLGTTDSGGVVPNASANNPDEIANASAVNLFVTRVMSGNSASVAGEFDDLVAWLSPHILFNRMVAAGRLP